MGVVKVRTFQSALFPAHLADVNRIALEQDINMFITSLLPQNVLEISLRLQSIGKYSQLSCYVATVVYYLP